jgi:hypothetical protein
MGELQDYYDNFRTGYWACEDETECPCRGRGWALSEVDTWHKCPVHFVGQLDPLLMDSVDDWDYLDAADYGSRLAWAVKHGLASFTQRGGRAS